MERRDLRHKMLKKRKTLTPETVEAVSLEVCEKVKDLDCFREGRKIASYMAVNGEIDPRHLESSGKVFAFPVVQKTGNLKFFRVNGNLAMGALGIPEPTSEIEEQLQTLDVVIVPLVATDRVGNRLGHGAGYYDKTFDSAKVSKRPKLIGLAHSFQVVEKIQPEEWDVPLDIVVTENEVFFGEIAHARVSMGEY
ncbi:MAG: 5-formyltetrahydrofolate cyclo-ligase [Acidimicrobiales bacterium]|jgi:5-formyltetrahydrofolate cyclo-ligase|nr:5-formyltetrahydrofolate cyclo-ligase [Acidimicrobiales bacterium]